MNKKQIIENIERELSNAKHDAVLMKIRRSNVSESYYEGQVAAYESLWLHINELEEFPISELYAELGILQGELYDNQEHGEANGVKMAMIRIGQFVKRKKAESEQGATNPED